RGFGNPTNEADQGLDGAATAPYGIHQVSDLPLNLRARRMLEGLFYLMASFWLGAVHAATPGHGKTIAASYIVGVRGRPIDGLVLRVFFTLSHTSGIILVAVLATFGYAWLIPQRVEAYLAVGTGILVVGIGCWMVRTQIGGVALAHSPQDSDL